MRTIDCECGETLKAANDDDLAQAVRQHVADKHQGSEMSEDQARELVAANAYDAMDA
jgi:hypothetical protein